MIVYFWEKSKKQYREWGILTLIIMVEVYMGFVWTKNLVGDATTLQILKKEEGLDAFRQVNDAISTPEPVTGEYSFVASKKGKYYYPKDCGKAKALSVQNMLYFKDKMSSEAAGYMPYLGCK